MKNLKKVVVGTVILGTGLGLCNYTNCNTPNNTTYSSAKKTISTIQPTNNNVEQNVEMQVNVQTDTINCQSDIKAPDEPLIDGWTTDRLRVRIEPNINSEVLDVLEYNTHIQYNNTNDNEWLKINYEGKSAYICAKYVKNEEQPIVTPTPKPTSTPTPTQSPTSKPGNTVDIPRTATGFKSYMSYRKITNKKSRQYILQHTEAYTGTYGIRQVNGRYCVAVGTSVHADIGQYVDIVLDNGTIIPIIVGDIKDDRDTYSDNIVTSANGCCTEFIIDEYELDSKAKRSGDISSCNDSWNTKVQCFKVYDTNIFNN